MKKVLVTGVAGFIASKVCEFLLNEGIEVIGLDDLNDYYDVRLKKFRLQTLFRDPKFQFHQINIENKTDLANIFKSNQFDAVYNLAARAGVRYSIENPDIYLSTNAQGTLNLLEEMKKNKCNKIVLASTSSMYAGQNMPFKEDLPVNEPISPYAASKKAAELLCYTYHHLYKIDVSVVRYFTVYGPAGRPDMSIFRFIRWIREGQELEIFGDGLQARDFTYVDDIARGTILAGKKHLGYEIINLGGGQNPISLQTIISTLEDLIGKKARLKHQSFHKADMKETWADISKAKRLLGWEPITGIHEGLKKTVKSFDEHSIYSEINLP